MPFTIALGDERVEMLVRRAIAVSAQPMRLLVDTLAGAQVVVFPAEDPTALAGVEEARRRVPEAQIVLLAPEQQVERLRSQLPFVPYMASAWVEALSVSPEALAELLSKAAAASGRRSTVRALRREINQQVQSLAGEGSRPEERRQRQLELSEHYLSTLLAQAPQSFVAITPQGVIAAWNAAAEKLFGLSADQVLGQPVGQVLPAPAATELLAVVRQVLEHGAVSGREMILERPAGIVHADVSATAVEDRGQPITVSLVLHDVTARRAAEAGLRRSELRYRTLTESLPQLVWTCRPDGGCDYFSQQWLQYTGLDAAEQIGLGWLDRVIHPDDRERTLQQWEAATTGNQPYDIEYRIRRFDGVYHWFKARGVAIRDDDGTIAQWFGTCTDIEDIVTAREAVRRDAQALEAMVREETRRRMAAERALHRAQKMEAIGNLTGGIAHDFNNILQVINGNLQLLGDDIAGNERAQRRVHNACLGVERASKLASQLLAFGRRQPLAPKVINIGRFVRDMDDMLRRTLGEGIEVETSVAGGLWNTLVDPSNVESALLNLALNARDAMGGDGRLTIEVGNAFLDDAYADSHDELEPGQYVMLAVTDTGCGIEPELVDKVFEPFFTTKGEGRGTGLGLSMVYGFVKQSGGHIKIYSEPGHGTTFKIYLPRSLQSEDVLINVDAGLVRGGSETVLVVEDDEAVRETVVATLTGLGYAVLKARDAQAALSIIESGLPIDLLFTDVVMPGPLKSTELARKARQRLPDLAVLFTSGYTQNAIVHGGRLDEGVELLSKPYSREALARKFRHVLANAAQQAQARAPAPAARAAPAASSSRTTLLLCEDDPSIRSMLCELLEVRGHRVLAAANARQALDLDSRHSYDVLVTDLGLPDMSGLELADRLRERHPRLPVVFATGQGEYFPEAPQWATVISKPFDFAALQRAIETALKG